jgi:hypothetical protein
MANQAIIADSFAACYNVSMVRAHKQRVRIQPGGKVEIVSTDLPSGQDAEVIVLVSNDASPVDYFVGLFEDSPELIDRIVSEAMAGREQPLRQPCG